MPLSSHDVKTRVEKTTYEKRYALYFSPNIIREIKLKRRRWAEHVACVGERRGTSRVLEVKPEGRRPLGRPMLRWEDNIKMDFQDVGWGMDWIGMARDKDRYPSVIM